MDKSKTENVRMKKIVLYIAASLDGYIADADNRIDWLTSYSGNYGYDDFLQSVDTVMMGRKTYDAVAAMGIKDPYPHQHSYVFTKNPEQYAGTKNILFTSESPSSIASAVREGGGKNIFLVGGGTVIADCLEHNLIDEIILFIVPVVLGSGIPLFEKISHRITFTAVSSKTYDDGMIELRFQKK